MIAVIKPSATAEQKAGLVDWIRGQGIDVHISEGHDYTVLGLIGDTSKIDMDLIASLDIVESVKRVAEPFKQCSRKFHPDDTVVEVGGVKIFFCHGHTRMVGSGTGLLEQAAREAGCKIALFGHTHVSCCRYQEGLYVMNPGSPAQPRDGRRSYGIIDITPSGTLPYVVKLDP